MSNALPGGGGRFTALKTNMTLEGIPIFNRKYIFKFVDFSGVYLQFQTSPSGLNSNGFAQSFSPRENSRKDI